MGKKFWDVKMKANSTTEGEIYIYGEIDNSMFWGDEVTPNDFRKELKALGEINTLHVHINSPGGNVFAGAAIYNMLKNHTAKKITYNDGLAASMSSLLLMVGDERHSALNAMTMIHNPSGGGDGTADEHRKLAEILDKIRGTMIPAYMEKSGLSEEEVIAIMDAATWFTAQEAKDKGLIDIIDNGLKIAASIDGSFLMCGNEKFEMPETDIEAIKSKFNLGEYREETQPVANILQEQRNEFNKIKIRLLEV